MYQQTNTTETFRERQLALLEEAEDRRLARQLRAAGTSTQIKTTMANNLRKMLAILAAALAVLVAASFSMTAKPAHASTTFTVNQITDVADENLADNVCDINSFVSGQQCTLRAAIQEANDTSGADIINFNLFGGGTIQPKGPLPDITQQVTIDGYTQPGASPNTLAKGTNANILIELDGSGAGFATTGLEIRASNSVVKGLAINRFRGRGIEILGSAATGVKVEGNFIGTDPSGTVDLGNGSTGVEIFSGSDVTVGGSTPGARNLISGNQSAGVVAIFSSRVKVLGNLIGTKKDGTSALGNLIDGVDINESDDSDIGGTTSQAANVIAFNGLKGVDVEGDMTVSILRNSIFSNGGLGIDLGEDGVTANDQGDADVGPNERQNKPNISSAVTSGGSTTIKGTLNTKPNQTYTVRFFSSPSGDEGKGFRGQKSVTTNAVGTVSFSFATAQPVQAGQKMTATATDSSGNTSEFSAPRNVVTQ